MNGRDLANKIREWAKGDLISKEDLEKMTVEELLELMDKDKY